MVNGAGVIGGFERSLLEARLYPLKARGVETLQINLGYLCNQACSHCHVEASPTRVEVMSKEVMEGCLKAIDSSRLCPTGVEADGASPGVAILKVDLTGGAPEMNPNFRWFVTELKERGCHIISRCNLTILTEEGYEWLPEFYRENDVEVVASLPCYTKENTDAQRGRGTFERSIEGIGILNGLGYGGGDRTLNLVYNPGGPYLPPLQVSLESDYRRNLGSDFGVTFDSLFTITNMPIGRFLESLKSSGEREGYMGVLVEAFNGEAAANVMCRELISVGWDGALYDCDFNQILGLQLSNSKRGAQLPLTIEDFDAALLSSREILTGNHCYGCTAGAGSSCGGAVVGA